MAEKQYYEITSVPRKRIADKRKLKYKLSREKYPLIWINLNENLCEDTSIVGKQCCKTITSSDTRIGGKRKFDFK